MNKIIAGILVTIFALGSIGQAFAGSNMDFNIDNDYAYFPGGSYANDRLYDAGGLKEVNIQTQEDTFGFTLYKVLFGNELFYYQGKYSNIDPYYKKNSEEHKKLFQAIFMREYNNQKIIDNPNNKTEYLQRQVKLEKEVKLSQLRYEKILDAQKDTKEIEKRLIPVLDLYFDSSNYKQSDLRFEQESICKQSLFQKINFSMERSEFKNIKKYYLFAVNGNNSNAAPWGKNTSMSRIVTAEKDLLSLNKKMFFFQQVNVSEKKKMYKVRDGVQEQYKMLKYTPEYDKFVNKEFLDLSFQIDYSDLVEYYRGVGVDYHQKMSFSLLGIDAKNKVHVLSYDTGNISVELEENTVNKEKILQACKSFTQEPQNRLFKTKIGEFFEKLDKKYGLDKVNKKQSSWKGVLLITQKEKYNLEKYKRLLNKLYKQVESYKQKIEKQLQQTIYTKNSNVLINKKKIEKLGTIYSILNSINTTISEPTDYIDYRGISNAGKLGDINGYLLRYKEVIVDKKSGTAVLYSCAENPEMCIGNKDELEEATELEVKKDKFVFEDTDLIKMYYEELDRKTFERAYQMKYNPNYGVKHLAEIYKDIVRISKPTNIIKIKDFYKFKVIMIDSKGVPETYLVNVKIIDGKIKTLSSKKIK